LQFVTSHSTPRAFCVRPGKLLGPKVWKCTYCSCSVFQLHFYSAYCWALLLHDVITFCHTWEILRSFLCNSTHNHRRQVGRFPVSTSCVTILEAQFTSQQ
jgi:hypothetical protein